ncbi:MAG: ABC transporter substrate-binding protein, partial [Methanospirillum sp.]|nr:ABC transporter substrate-binding protein [Methanospirillum sp.]
MYLPLSARHLPGIIRGLILLLMISVTFIGSASGDTGHPYRVGVLLPSSGDSDMDFFETLNWTADSLNQKGIGGDIELVFADTSQEPVLTAARRMIDDPSIQVVIGPATSDETFLIAPEFIRAKKVLISPSATSANISTVFNNSGYFWMTASGDQVQTGIIMDILAERDAGSVSLLYVNNTYGRSFSDWSGYYAEKAGLNLSARIPFETEAGIPSGLSAAIAGEPDHLIVVAQGSDAAQVPGLIHELNCSVQPFFTDGAEVQTFLDTGDTEGAEGTSPAADKTTGFYVAYKEHFGKMPPNYASQTRDALVLAVAALARMEASPSEDIGSAMKNILSGRDGEAGWDDQDTAAALRMIRAGMLPDLTGASGPLDYDQGGVDPKITWYGAWQVENQTFLLNRSIAGHSGELNRSVPGEENTSPDSFPAPDDSGTFRVTLVYSGEKGDFGYVDQAYLGLIRAREDLPLITREVNGSDPGTDLDPVTDKAGNKADLVIFLGGLMNEYVQQVSKRYPDIPLVIVDAGEGRVKNTRSVDLPMYGASYLAGILASNQTKTGKIAVIAGMNNPVI